MKALPNSTNGVIVLSDSFATSIFKQSFLRIFSKDEQGNLQMGFNATFDVQVRGCAYTSPRLILTIRVGNKRAQGFRPDRTWYFCRQEISMCR